MKPDALIAALQGYVGTQLATDLVTDYLKVRQDYATRTLERAPCGKFIETCVQCFEYISTGKFSVKPDVDLYLDKKAEGTSLPDGLRICAARVARSVYTFRNKRSIAHKNEIDPNIIDLGYIFYAASWIMAEFIRNASGVTMDEAARLITLLQTTVGPLIEDIDGTRLVHQVKGDRAAVLVLLESHYPTRVHLSDILKTFATRNALSIKKRIAELTQEQLIFGDKTAGYVLTNPGYNLAREEIEKLLN